MQAQLPITPKVVFDASTLNRGQPARAWLPPQEPKMDLKEVIAVHGRYLLGRAFWLTRSASDAWDLFQDTMVRALGAPSERVDPDRARTWLLRIMHNRFLDICRSGEVRRRLPLTPGVLEGLVADAAVDPEAEEPWFCIDATTLWACVRKLGQPLREVFELHVRGVSNNDIAAHLKIPVSTVGTRMFRARRHLRALIEECVGGELGLRGAPCGRSASSLTSGEGEE